jgi:hypothetical protein
MQAARAGRGAWALRRHIQWSGWNVRSFRSACWKILAVGFAAAVAVMTGTVPAYAASWQVVASPNASGNDYLGHVAAISPSNLWSVGGAYSLSSSEATLIEHYNGTSWQITPSPNPANCRYCTLLGVSGSSASDIWSVGLDLVSKGRTFPLIEHYNGSAWSLVPSAAPTQLGGLADVAALSPANAWAVGSGRAPGGPLVEHYNGTSWLIVPTALTTGGDLAAMTAVSANDIWAVGNQPGTAGANPVGLAMHYDGTSWTQSALPAPSVPAGGLWELSGISAASGSDVWAVGYWSSADGLSQHVIVEHFNGTSWSLTQAPDLGPNYPINVASGVAALSPTDVWAIGQSSPGNQTFATLVEHFDGTKWTVQPAPSMSGNFLSFAGLVSTGPGQLWATGARIPNGSGVFQTATAHYS